MDGNAPESTSSLVLRDTQPLRPVSPGIRRRILAHSPTLMLVEHEFDAGVHLPRHAHPQEQLVYVVTGRLRLEVGGQTFAMAAGDSALIPGDVEHEADTLEACVVLDTFAPARPDFSP